jgi:hypothetical protein
VTLVLTIAARSGSAALAAAEFYLLSIVISWVVALAMVLRRVCHNKADDRSRDRSTRGRTASPDQIGSGCTLPRHRDAAPPLALSAPPPKSGRTR